MGEVIEFVGEFLEGERQKIKRFVMDCEKGYSIGPYYNTWRVIGYEDGSFYATRKNWYSDSITGKDITNFLGNIGEYYQK